jgi:diadenosine tetraphosphate (Ap4A) HIT family hydrolase
MIFEDLKEFISNKQRMKMQHIYQPLLIKTLIECGGTATIRQLAQCFLAQDESQLRYYEDKIKKMPLKVLLNHGIVSKDYSLVSLSTKNLTLEQKAELKMLCEKRMQEYIIDKGLDVWNYSLLDDPVPGSLRYRVLKESGGRCALCGATKNERPLDIDHIKPRSKKGKTSIENLQVLCSACNRAKGNRDQTDLRKLVGSDSIDDCPFCESKVRTRVVDELDTVVAIRDDYPVAPGHMLVVPKRHTADYFSMTMTEKDDCSKLLAILKRKIIEGDPSVSGFNVGMNCGETAGQTIFHAHVHLIPRRPGDCTNPRGGVRGVIPDKMHY